MAVKTRGEVDELKAEWLANSQTTLLECTPGFEEYYNELKAYREGVEAAHSPNRVINAEKLAIELMCSVPMAHEILRLRAAARTP